MKGLSHESAAKKYEAQLLHRVGLRRIIDV